MTTPRKLEAPTPEEGIRKLRKRYNERFDVIEKKLKAATDRLNAIEPQTVEATFKELEERVDRLGRLHAVSILKDCVTTEVLRSVAPSLRELVVDGLLRALNAENDWWLAQSGKTIREWRITLMDLSVEPAALPPTVNEVEPAMESEDAESNADHE